MTRAQPNTDAPRQARVLRYMLLAIFCLALGGVWIADVVADIKKDTLGFELAKVLLQVGLLSAVGAFLSHLAFRYQTAVQAGQKEREEAREHLRRETERALDLDRSARAARKELFTGTLTTATDSYSSVIRARRILRSRVLVPAGGDRHLRLDDYEAQLRVIIDTQLEFRNLVRQVETLRTEFTHPDDLVAAVSVVEKYLSKLVTEYEERRRDFAGDPPVLTLTTLPTLDGFLASPRHDPARFAAGGFESFLNNFTTAQDLLRRELLGI